MRLLRKLRRPGFRRPGRPVVAGVTAAVLAAGAAAGASTTPQQVTVTAGTPATQLFPGDQAAVAVTLGNPNAFPVRVGSLALNTTQGTGGYAVDAGHASCGVAALSYATQDNGGTGWTVPPRVGGVDGSLAVQLTGALSMSLSAPNACQGASFTVYLRIP